MTVDELENAVLKLDSKSRARLAERLLKSLENLSDAENAQLWAEEAQRRDRELDIGEASSRPAEDVLRDARTRLS